ncbi:hypothetical protein AB835_12215 [Candidatus Endobugula sertula]|uniref:DUF1289 domain-containing protein n=1 Tax=Candidatus Endobugula sertula TaxID=62101 RepID=A0A1D2QMJ0_9GAMM|nr:hypothetical protein AB835_12215 [Candidatus Endobugula sertula]
MSTNSYFLTDLEDSSSLEKPVKSPCISICALDDNDICTGCFRSADEITGWGHYSNKQKREVLAQTYKREKEVNPFL